MLPGAPACASKKTLCATGPKANVTDSPAFTSSDGGLNLRSALAATVWPSGGGAVTSPPPPLDPQPARAAPASRISANLVVRADMVSPRDWEAAILKSPEPSTTAGGQGPAPTSVVFERSPHASHCDPWRGLTRP